MGLIASPENSFNLSLRGHYFQFRTDSGVFSRRRLDPGTRLLAEKMTLPAAGRILDLGCGYGPLGIIAAKLLPQLHVVLTDSSKTALRLARVNASLNRVENVEFRLGSVYGPVQGMQFSLIVSNPPFSAGFAVVSEIIRSAPMHLTGRSALQLVVRKGFEMIKRECELAFGSVEIIGRGSGYRVFHAKLTKT